MTKEEAIKALLQIDCPENIREVAESVLIQIAMKEPCEDAISREDALIALTCEIKDGDTIESMIGKFGERIRNLPSVQPKGKPRRKGQWELKYDNLYHCSLCDFDEYVPYGDFFKSHRFCPNCGAEMEE